MPSHSNLTHSDNAQNKNIGWVPYLNLFPLKVELKKNKHFKFNFVSEHPAELNKLFNGGAFSAAPCSSVNLLKLVKPNLVKSLGIAANGEVSSVYLGLNGKFNKYLSYIKERNAQLKILLQQECLLKEREDFSKNSKRFWSLPSVRNSYDKTITRPTLRLTKNSATSVQLAKSLFELWFGKDDSAAHYTENLDENTWDLLIGDEALQYRKRYTHIIDLGSMWKEITSLPFVYAVWLTRSGDEEAIKHIIDAAEIAEMRMRIEPSYYHDRLSEKRKSIISPEQLSSYWKKIRYKLKPADIKSLTLFLNLAISEGVAREEISQLTTKSLFCRIGL